MEEICRLTSRRSQPPLPLRLQSTPRVGGGSAFYVRRQKHFGRSSVELLTVINKQQKGYVMKTLLGLVVGLFVSSQVGLAAESVSSVPFELGPQHFSGGDSIVIEQVEASSPLL